MGLVLWIDQNTFATALLEKIFKKKNLPFYTISSAEDFSYLVDDIRPELIVLDAVTVKEHLDAFKTQYEASELLQALPFIFIDNEIAGVKNALGVITRPFDPFSIPQKIQEFFNID